MKYLWKLALPFINVYEGEGEGSGEGSGEGTGTETPPPAGGGGAEDDKPRFTQKQVNDFLAKEKGKHQKATEAQVKELEKIKASKGLTEKEKSELQTRIEDLQNSMLTKEQLAQKEREKLQNEHKKTLDTVAGERDFYRGLYQKSTITRSISDEAAAAEAFNPRQVVALLESKTRLVEALDGDGQPIPGEFVVRVKMDDVDSAGKPTTLDLSVAEALKRMKDRSDEFGNLFKSGVSGGLGGSSGKGGTKEVDPSKLSPEEYRKWRNSRLGRDKK